jgi:hypothetical protein
VRIDHVQERLLDGRAGLGRGRAILDGERAIGERADDETERAGERE